MESVLSVAIGAGFGLLGVLFGSWFTAHRQDRMWIREQKLKAGVDFNTAATQLLDHFQQTRLGDDGVGANELVDRLQEARSAIYLLCSDRTVDLSTALARRVWDTRPADGGDDRKTHINETNKLLRRFTHQLRQEIAKS